MKKYLALSLLFFTVQAYSMSVKEALWIVFGPVQSIDAKVEKGRIRRGCYDSSADSKVGDVIWKGMDNGALPRLQSSVDSEVKYIILSRNNRLEERFPGRGIPLYKDSDVTWKKQLLKDRLYWTMIYRRPYTHFLTAGKWALEIATVVGCIKLAQKFKKWYQERAKPSVENVQKHPAAETISSDSEQVGS